MGLILISLSVIWFFNLSDSIIVRVITGTGLYITILLMFFIAYQGKPVVDEYQQELNNCKQVLEELNAPRNQHCRVEMSYIVEG